MPSSRRPLLVLAVLGLVTTAALWFGPPANAQTKSRTTARTLLQNPGFERGVANHPWMPTGWDTSRADLPTVFFGRDTFLVRSGQWSVNVANMSTAFPMAHNWSQTLLVGPEHWGKTAVFRGTSTGHGTGMSGIRLWPAGRFPARAFFMLWTTATPIWRSACRRERLACMSTT